jgi:2-keto-3-deoxy-6-phosphogluconate aldolase
MQAQKVREAIIGQKLIAIIRGVEGGKIIETVDALSRGGIHLVEITLDQSDEADCRKPSTQSGASATSSTGGSLQGQERC